MKIYFMNRHALNNHIIVQNPRHFKKLIKVVCVYRDFHNLEGCIANIYLPPQKPLKVIYRSDKNFDGEKFKNDVSQIPFHICTIFNDV